MPFCYRLLAAVFLAACLLFGSALNAESGGSTAVTGSVTDPTGAVVPNARVEIHNPVSGFDRVALTDSSGQFAIANVPFNPYHLTVTAKGFSGYVQDVDVRSAVPIALSITLQVAGSAETVTVEAAGDLIENDPISHTDLDKALFDKLRWRAHRRL